MRLLIKVVFGPTKFNGRNDHVHTGEETDTLQETGWTDGVLCRSGRVGWLAGGCRRRCWVVKESSITQVQEEERNSATSPDY